MIDEGQTGGQDMVVISESEYQDLKDAEKIVKYGIPAVMFSIIFFLWKK